MLSRRNYTICGRRGMSLDGSKRNCLAVCCNITHYIGFQALQPRDNTEELLHELFYLITSSLDLPFSLPRPPPALEISPPPGQCISKEGLAYLTRSEKTAHISLGATRRHAAPGLASHRHQSGSRARVSSYPVPVLTASTPLGLRYVSSLIGKSGHRATNPWFSASFISGCAARR